MNKELIQKLRKAAIQAQIDGVQTDRRLGKSDKEIAAGIDSWGVTVKSGDLLRVLNAIERKMGYGIDD